MSLNTKLTLVMMAGLSVMVLLPLGLTGWMGVILMLAHKPVSEDQLSFFAMMMLCVCGIPFGLITMQVLDPRENY